MTSAETGWTGRNRKGIEGEAAPGRDRERRGTAGEALPSFFLTGGRSGKVKVGRPTPHTKKAPCGALRRRGKSVLLARLAKGEITEDGQHHSPTTIEQEGIYHFPPPLRLNFKP